MLEIIDNKIITGYSYGTCMLSKRVGVCECVYIGGLRMGHITWMLPCDAKNIYRSVGRSSCDVHCLEEMC